MIQPKVLLVPNEPGVSVQRSSRRALTQLSATKRIGPLSVYSLIRRVEAVGAREALNGLIRRVEEFQPEIVVMQHPSRTGLTRNHLESMRSVADFSLMYYEGDPYSRYLHPLPPEGRALAKEADIVHTVGAGDFADNFRRAGASRVEWSPSRFDPASFGVKAATLDKRFDVVMIANRSRPRLPFRALPGASDRIRLVEYMQKRFGDRFAIFGNGWEGVSARGPLAFWDQEEAIGSSWITVNWDHYPKEPKYFSNRLPISLACGSIHITGYHPGYEEVFPDAAQFIHFATSPEEIVDQAAGILRTTTPLDRLDMAAQGRSWAHTELRADDQAAQWIAACGVELAKSHVQDAWRCEVSPSDEL